MRIPVLLRFLQLEVGLPVLRPVNGYGESTRDEASHLQAKPRILVVPGPFAAAAAAVLSYTRKR